MFSSKNTLCHGKEANFQNIRKIPNNMHSCPVCHHSSDDIQCLVSSLLSLHGQEDWHSCWDSPQTGCLQQGKRKQFIGLISPCLKVEPSTAVNHLSEVCIGILSLYPGLTSSKWHCRSGGLHRYARDVTAGSDDRLCSPAAWGGDTGTFFGTSLLPGPTLPLCPAEASQGWQVSSVLRTRTAKGK